MDHIIFFVIFMIIFVLDTLIQLLFTSFDFYRVHNINNFNNFSLLHIVVLAIFFILAQVYSVNIVLLAQINHDNLVFNNVNLFDLQENQLVLFTAVFFCQNKTSFILSDVHTHLNRIGERNAETGLRMFVDNHFFSKIRIC